MPWTPQNDFEEEVVNLQPDHDFIFGSLSEPQYPRPAAHTEYAATRKLEEKKQQKEFAAAGSALSAKLRVIQQVQRIANIKPLGEQPSLDDWDSNENLEQETIGMMRHFGLGASVEQPLNEKATIATYPVPKENRILRNGRRSVPLFLDDNMFKLREKSSDTSSGFESCNNSDTNKLRSDKNESLASELSADTSSSFSYATAGACNDSFASAAPTKISIQRLNQYGKLIEDTSLHSLDCSKSSISSQSESLSSISKSSWTPLPDDYDADEDLFKKKENWPIISKKNKKNISCDFNTTENDDVFNNTQTDSIDDISSEASGTMPKRENFLDRFIKPNKSDNLASTSDSSASTTSSQEPTTYASIAKAPKPSEKKKKTNPPDFITNFPPFYTPRHLYALKRSTK